MPVKLECYHHTDKLPGQRVIHNTVDEVVDRIARDIMAFAMRRVAEVGEFHIALSGGSTPKALFKHWIIDPDFRLFPWTQTHIWIVDERVVPFSDDRSNYKMMKELLFDHIPIDPEQIHPMIVMDEDGADAYNKQLKDALAGVAEKRLDLVILGMGPDGHTASLFPKTEGLSEVDRLVIFNDGELVIEPRPRMTMTYPVINGARKIMTLLTGTGKFDMLQTIQDEESDPTMYPIMKIKPTYQDGEMFWYMDSAAACGEEFTGVSEAEDEDDEPIELV